MTSRLCLCVVALFLRLLAWNPCVAFAESLVEPSRPHLHHSVEKRLIQTLLDNYKRYGILGRPVNRSDVLMSVEYGLALVQILDLDENKQVLRTICWSRYRWRDNLLRWNPKKYGEITQIRVYPNQLWTPDIKLYNFADERLKEHRQARVVVHHDGLVMWVPQALFKSTCPVEITYFPFDRQTCELEFGSWSYDVTQLDISFWIPAESNVPSPYVDFSDYVESNEWYTDGQYERFVNHTSRRRQIRSVKNFRKVSYMYTDGRKNIRSYPTLRYLVRLRRNPSFYVSILVIPCILLSSLTLVLFWLPPESPAKLMLGMNIFVAFFILLLLLAESTPSAVKNFPLIGGYYCLNMVLITLSTFLAVIVINLYSRGDKKGPVPVNLRRVLIEGLGRLLLVRQYIPLLSSARLARLHAKSSPSPPPPPLSPCHMGRARLITKLRPHHFMTGTTELDLSPRVDPDPPESPILTPRGRTSLESDLGEIRHLIRIYVNRQKDRERQNVIAMEWRTLALVLDRLFFCLYVIAISVAIIVLIPVKH